MAFKNQMKTENTGTGTASAGIAEPRGASYAADWLAGLATGPALPSASARNASLLTARKE
ncbi:hypothetical protein IB267_14580 [Ensifer sp. ENS09]|uniref:hypothetical protein n=1 Tax=Ensifer sp. ENS09 TaxID=2769263 RepID=UPI00177E4E69|nr:hypothetical protein [Ensifer sp. ENS09]MBD9649584.1 hypothetical protein [Ensifer sp. ENS09]